MKLQEREQLASANRIVAERRGDRARVLKACSNTAVMIVGGVASVTFPPALLILPVLLPIVILIAEAYEVRKCKLIASKQSRSVIPVRETRADIF